MNWDALGALAEMVGSTAVILTLVYLALQTRQNSVIASAESGRDTTKAWDDALQDIIRNNATMLPAMRDLAPLDADARYAAISRMARLIQAHGVLLQQAELNVVSEQRRQIADQVIASVLTTPAGRIYWAASSEVWFYPDHVNEVLQSYEGPSWIEFFEHLERRIETGDDSIAGSLFGRQIHQGR